MIVNVSNEYLDFMHPHLNAPYEGPGTVTDPIKFYWKTMSYITAAENAEASPRRMNKKR